MHREHVVLPVPFAVDGDDTNRHALPPRLGMQTSLLELSVHGGGGGSRWRVLVRVVRVVWAWGWLWVSVGMGGDEGAGAGGVWTALRLAGAPFSPRQADNFVEMLSGTKRFTLAPPADWHTLSPNCVGDVKVNGKGTCARCSWCLPCVHSCCAVPWPSITNKYMDRHAGPTLRPHQRPLPPPRVMPCAWQHASVTLASAMLVAIAAARTVTA